MKMRADTYQDRSTRKRTAVLEAELKTAEESIKMADAFSVRLVSMLNKGLTVELVDHEGQSVTIKAIPEMEQKSE